MFKNAEEYSVNKRYIEQFFAVILLITINPTQLMEVVDSRDQEMLISICMHELLIDRSKKCYYNKSNHVRWRLAEEGRSFSELDGIWMK